LTYQPKTDLRVPFLVLAAEASKTAHPPVLREDTEATVPVNDEQRHARGFLFVLEGIDGAGKTAAAQLLEKELRARGLDVVRLREPTSESKWGKEIRDRSVKGELDPEEELNLFMRDRRWHVTNKILPYLREGKIVLLDRYFFASGAYQTTSTGIHWSEILRRNREEIHAPEPDIVFLLDVPVEVGLSRLGGRSGDVNLQFEKRGRLEKVRQAYLEMAEHDSANFVVIDARASLQEVVTQILDAILELVNRHRSARKAVD